MQQKLIPQKEFEERLIQLFAQNRISQYPRKRRDRHILLKSIVITLERDKDYTEPEINEAIKSWLAGMHDPRGLDHVSLRRYLVDEGYLDRSRNGSRYWVMNSGSSAKWFEPDVDTVDVFQVVGEAKEKFDKTRRTRGEVRKKILDGALELFAEKGFEAASIREIADRAGVTVPNIYYYFKDKEGLYQAVLKDNVADLLEVITKLDDSNLPFRDRLVAVAKAKMRLASQKNTAIELFLKEWISHGETPGLTPTLQTAMQMGFKYLEDMISVAVKKGEIKPINPKMGVLYLISLTFFHGSRFISQFIKNREPMTDEEIEEYVELVMKGLEKK